MCLGSGVSGEVHLDGMYESWIIWMGCVCVNLQVYLDGSGVYLDDAYGCECISVVHMG